MFTTPITLRMKNKKLANLWFLDIFKALKPLPFLIGGKTSPQQTSFRRQQGLDDLAIFQETRKTWGF